MNREADYTIKGFIYQFNKTLEQIINEPEGTEITVEGIVEDIDVQSLGFTKAIQCKYHETIEKYKSSDIAKPILQMLVHYYKNQEKDIQYILYAHFSDEAVGERTLAKSEIETILKSKDKSLIKYISTLKPPKDNTIKDLVLKLKKDPQEIKQIIEYYNNTPDLEVIIDLDDFLKPNKFSFIIGKSFDDLISDAKDLLEKKSNFSRLDIEDLFYPNAIQKIADKSILHNSDDRKINNIDFISELEKSKKTAISRWTKELLSYSALLKKRRNQLKINLQKNHRLRCFLFDSKSILNFEDEIVQFITNYVDNYHHKIRLHSKTPMFCLDVESIEILPEIESRLHQKGLVIENGLRGKDFFEADFLREPKVINNQNWREFDIRLCACHKETIKAINSKKSDDLFLIGKQAFEEINKQDVNIELLEVTNLNELQYLLLLTDNID